MPRNESNAEVAGLVNYLPDLRWDTVYILTAGNTASWFTDTIYPGGIAKSEQDAFFTAPNKPWGEQKGEISGVAIQIWNHYRTVATNAIVAATLTELDSEELRRTSVQMLIGADPVFRFRLGQAPAGEGTFLQSDAAAAAIFNQAHGMPFFGNILKFPRPYPVAAGRNLKFVWSAKPNIVLTGGATAAAVTMTLLGNVDKIPR